MPTYQYACRECGHSFEQVQSFSEDSLTVCPVCQGSLRKVFNAVGVVFKGSGFYRNDSRSGSGSGEKSSSDTGSSEKSGSDKGSEKKDSGKSGSGEKSAPATKSTETKSSSSSAGSSTSSSTSSSSSS